MEREPVYIVGMGAITPVGNLVPIMWNNLLNGISGIDRIDFSSYRHRNTTRDTHDNPSDPRELDYFKYSIGAEVKNFSAEDRIYLPRNEIRRLDRFSQFAVAATEEAMAQAALNITDDAVRDRVTVIIGSGMGGLITIERQHDVMRQYKPDHVTPLLAPMIMSNAATAAVARRFGFFGPSVAPASACATGVDALGIALEKIQLGKADVAIAGGTDDVITPLSYSGFANMHALLKEYDGDPRKSSRPFDRARKGFVMGEGAGIMVLARKTFVKAHHLVPLVEIAGYGASQDAYHLTAPHPDGANAAKAVRWALADAGVEPHEIRYINVHGTGTPLNDRTEVAALKLALGTDIAQHIPASATKSMIGHLIGGAGAVESIVTALALMHCKAHETLNLEEIDPDCMGLDHIIGVPREIAVGAALKTAFGFGGHNSAIVFRRV